MSDCRHRLRFGFRNLQHHHHPRHQHDHHRIASSAAASRVNAQVACRNVFFFFGSATTSISPSVSYSARDSLEFLGHSCRMPRLLQWDRAGVLEAATPFTADLLYAALRQKCLNDPCAWLVGAWNKSSMVDAKLQMRSKCICCEPPCSRRVIVEEETAMRYVIKIAGHHGAANPCQKKVKGYTAGQWKIIDANPDADGDALLVLMDDAGLAAVDADLGHRLRQRDRNKNKQRKTCRTLQVCAQLRQWASNRSHASAQGPDFTPHTVFTLAVQIDSVLDVGGRFLVVFACEGHQRPLAKLDGPVVLSIDGTFKLVFGGYVLLIMGLLHIHLSKGRVSNSGRGQRGDIELPRISFAPLVFCWADVEDAPAYEFMIGHYKTWLQSWRPDLHDKLQSASQVVTDSHGGCINAVSSQFPQARSVRCAVHVRRNATERGHTGFKHLHRHKKAAELRKYIDLLAQAATPVIFDFLARQIIAIVSQTEAWGAEEGAEPEWAAYFSDTYLKEIIIDGVGMLSCDWRSGLDGSIVVPFAASTNSHESYNKLLKRIMKKAEQRCKKAKLAADGLPGFQEVTRILSETFHTELLTRSSKYSEEVVRSSHPPKMPDTIMKPCEAVQRYKLMPSVSQYAHYTGTHKLHRGSVEIFVMHAKTKGVQRNAQVRAADAENFVNMLSLAPAAHRHQDFWRHANILTPTRAGVSDEPYLLNVPAYERLTAGFAVVFCEYPRRENWWETAVCTCDWYRSRKCCSHHGAVRMWLGDASVDARPAVPGKAGGAGYRARMKDIAKRQAQFFKKRPVDEEADPCGIESEGDDAAEQAACWESVDTELRGLVKELNKRPMFATPGTRIIEKMRNLFVRMHAKPPVGIKWKTLWEETGCSASVHYFTKHINPVLGGKARDLITTVEGWIGKQEGMPPALQSSLGAARCAGQVGYPTVLFPKVAIKDLRVLFQANDTLGIETFAYLYGKKTHTGAEEVPTYILTDLVHVEQVGEATRVEPTADGNVQHVVFSEANPDKQLLGWAHSHHQVALIPQGREPSQPDVSTQACMQRCGEGVANIMLIMNETGVDFWTVPHDSMQLLAQVQCDATRVSRLPGDLVERASFVNMVDNPAETVRVHKVGRSVFPSSNHSSGAVKTLKRERATQNIKRESDAAMVSPDQSKRCCCGCGKSLKDTANFCPQCGKAVPANQPKEAPRFCGKCGNAYKPTANFCGQCGHRVTDQVF